MMLRAVMFVYDEGFVVQFKPCIINDGDRCKMIGFDVVCYRLEDIQCGHTPAFEFFHDSIVTPDESCAEFYYSACHTVRV